jgi:CBS domain-containing protein
MRISEIMTHEVQMVAPQDTLQTAARMMAAHDFGMVPVGENDRLVGMLTDRDITTRAVAQGLIPGTCKVAEVMSPDVNYVYDDESVEDVARNMSVLQVRRLPVLDREKRLVGIVSLGDLAVNKPKPAGDALSSISQPQAVAG